MPDDLTTLWVIVSGGVILAVILTLLGGRLVFRCRRKFYTTCSEEEWVEYLRHRGTTWDVPKDAPEVERALRALWRMREGHIPFVATCERNGTIWLRCGLVVTVGGTPGTYILSCGCFPRGAGSAVVAAFRARGGTVGHEGWPERDNMGDLRARLDACDHVEGD
jgi:hypothetical protein